MSMEVIPLNPHWLNRGKSRACSWNPEGKPKWLVTAYYFKDKKTPLAQQIRTYLAAHGASTCADIGHALVEEDKSYSMVCTEVNTACIRMSKSGVCHREKMQHTSYYSLVKGREDVRARFSPSAMLKAKALFSRMHTLAQRVDVEIRSEVLSELFYRMMSGRHKPAEMERVFHQSIKSVRKDIRGGYKESVSLDAPLTEGDDSNLHQLVASDETDSDGLFRLEYRAQEIASMEADGYGRDQYWHLLESAGSSWLNRRID